ncbi:SMI1/KNR4 family protein [Shewanella donghaensis]|uniref:SMI1/KNR4 family protein n=1 Tax=Shewanella donghaensis TaxID=238836 RepID=UPI001183A42B|nr:SMI1/KNR4 family protein [Shewanella donghaensis]
MSTSFIPNTFNIPLTLNTEHFSLCELAPNVTQQDFDAVMSSLKRLKCFFGPSSIWPEDTMTLEENTASLAIHQQEFNAREAFAYSVFNKSNTRCLGSVYIDPSRSQNYDCEVYFWIREDSVDLEDELYNTVKKWLKNIWPFTKFVFPGRSVDWKTWSREINNNQQVQEFYEPI